MTRMQYTVSVAMSPLDDLLEIAKAAEELGFDNIALPDSIFYMEQQSADYPYTPTVPGCGTRTPRGSIRSSSPARWAP